MIKEGKARPTEAQGPSTSAIVKRTLAHWPMIAAVMFIGAAATAEVVHLRKPAFKSETVIFYREGIQKSLVTNDPSAPDPLRTLGAKLKEMLLAQANLKKVIHEKNLYGDIIEKQDENAAVEQFRKKIDFKARSTDTFVISFEGTSREEAQDVTSRLAELLVEENAQIKQEQAKTTTQFLDVEKKRSDEELSKVEAELAKFVADHPEYAGSDPGTGKVGISVKAREVEQQGADRRREARRKPFSPSAPATALPASVDPALVTQRNNAQAELANAKRDLSDKAAKYTDDYPDVRLAKQRVLAAEAVVRGIEDQISAQAAANPPPAPAPSPPPAIYEPREPRAAQKGSASASPSAAPTAPPIDKDAKVVAAETEWSRLNRDVAKARQRAGDLENRLFKAEMTASSELGGYAAQIAILDPAYRPTGPSSTPNKTVVAAGFLASLLLGAALAALRGLFMDDRVFDESEIDPIAVGPVLAVVPRTIARRKGKKRG